MKVPIKFRADSCIGKVYGYFVKREGKAYIVNEVGTWVSVDEESVRQLVGYTKEKEEVYKGDDKLVYREYKVVKRIEF